MTKELSIYIVQMTVILTCYWAGLSGDHALGGPW